MISGKTFYGRHFHPGVAQYSEHDNLKIYVPEDTAKKMDETFSGKPVFVDHQDVDPESFSNADGYVARSFYEPLDGSHWAEFVVTTEKGLECIKKGYKLSNSYYRVKESGGGEHIAVPYQKKLVNGRYEHLAIVKSPRYEKSVIMTPEEFKEYRNKKQKELEKMQNSKPKPKNRRKKPMKFINKIFKKVDLSEDLKDSLEDHRIKLDNSDEELSLDDVIELAEEALQNKKRKNDDDDMDNDDDDDKMKSKKKNKKRKNKDDDDEDMDNEKDDEDMDNDDDDDDDDMKSKKNRKSKSSKNSRLSNSNDDVLSVLKKTIQSEIRKVLSNSNSSRHNDDDEYGREKISYIDKLRNDKNKGTEKKSKSRLSNTKVSTLSGQLARGKELWG